MKLLIIVPAYNDEKNIKGVAEEIQQKVPQYDYVVINDGSRDHTAEICQKEGYPLLNLPSNLGLTGAFQAGMLYAFENHYDAVIQIDGDGQHDPANIPAMEKLMEEGDLDLVLASRFVTEKHNHTLRSIGNSLLNRAVRLTTGKTITDSTSGMRLYGKRLIRNMALDINASPEPDTLAYLLRGGAKYAEIQVQMRDRTAGESYLSPWKSVKYMIQRIMNILFVQWFREKPKIQTTAAES